MAGISDTIKALLNRGLSIFHKTKLGDILAAQLPPYTFPNGSADGFVKYTTAGTTMETQTYATASNIADVTKDTESAGTSKTVARGDHKHDISTAAASTLTPTSTSAEGNATSLARSNHTHACTCAAATQNDWNQANAEGDAASFARSNHKHADKGTVKRFSQVIGFAGITDPGATKTIVLTSPPTNAIFLGGCVELDAPFIDGAACTVTAQIGDAGDPNEMAGVVAIGTGEALGIKDGIPTASLTWQGVQAAYAPAVLFTGSVNLNTLTAGSCIVHLYYIQAEVVTA